MTSICQKKPAIPQSDSTPWTLTLTQGHTARRMAVDYGIPLITDVKCAKLLVSALYALKNQAPEVQTSIDCISEGRLIRLPGLIDTHVHLRYTLDTI